MSCVTFFKVVCDVHGTEQTKRRLFALRDEVLEHTTLPSVLTQLVADYESQWAGIFIAVPAHYEILMTSTQFTVDPIEKYFQIGLEEETTKCGMGLASPLYDGMEKIQVSGIFTINKPSYITIHAKNVSGIFTLLVNKLF
jgi:hypothetical protein